MDTIRPLSNNPGKAGQLPAPAITVAERVPSGVHVSRADVRCPRARAGHTHHTLDLPA